MVHVGLYGFIYSLGIVQYVGGNESLGCVKDGVFLEQLKDEQFLKTIVRV